MNLEIFERAGQKADAWSSLSLQDRSKVIAKMRKNIARRQVEISETIAIETGKPVTEVLNQEVTATLEMLSYFEKKYPRWLGERRFRYWRPGFWTKSNAIVFEPLGKIAVIGPSNFPFSLPLMAACSSLLCGNTAILKPSEHCPKTADIISSLIQESGLADGVWEIVRGGPEVTREVIAQPAVRKVIFIGSYKAGREVAEICGRYFKPCLLELGGWNAAIVCEDADLPWAAKGIAWSAFSAAGRSCVGTKQVFVPGSIIQRFIPLLFQEMKAIRLSVALDPSAEMAHQDPQKNLAKLKELVQDAMNKGATVWTQKGKAQDFSSLSLDGPILLIELSPVMPSAWISEEIQSPVLCVREAESVDQAAVEANACLSGLGASVWSRDLKKAKAIARRLKAGLVWINDSSVGLPQFPWGGINKSGWGRLFSELGVSELVCPKVISSEKRQGGRPKFWWFPYSKEKQEAFLALNDLLYGQKRVRKIFPLIAASTKNFLRARRH